MSGSARKSKETGQTQVKCAECHFIFPEDASPRRDYRKRNDGTFACRDQSGCRSRVLNVQLGMEVNPHKPAEWLWARFPRELAWDQMDVRPRNWRENGGWMPRASLEWRAFACILYHSWCYPVCTAYAVQLAHTCPLTGRVDEEPDEILRDHWRRPVPLRVKDIARILNEQPGTDEYAKRSGAPNISRAMKKLRDAGYVRVDEDGVIAIAPRLVNLSFDQRRQLWNLPGVDAGEGTPWMRSLPRRFRGMFAAILTSEHVPEHMRTDIVETVGGACTSFNEGLSHLRTTRDATIQEACSQGCILIPDWVKTGRSSSSPAPSVIRQQSNTAPHDDDGQQPQNELYRGDRGEGALAKLTRPRPADWVPTAIAEAIGEEDAARQIIARCREVAGDCTEGEILEAIWDKDAKAQRADNRIGFLLTAVPKLFAGAGLKRIRDRAAERQVEMTRQQNAQTERDRAMANEVLRNPDLADDEQKNWARQILGKSSGAAGDD